MTFNCAGVGVELRGGELQKTGESVAGSARRHHASEPLTARPQRGFVAEAIVFYCEWAQQNLLILFRASTEIYIYIVALPPKR